MKWDEHLSVGDTLIDEDHRQLFSMVERFRQAMRSGQERDVLGDILDELVHYTVGHFEREEYFMRRVNYANYTRHKAEHDRLISEVQYLKHSFHHGFLNLSDRVDNFLSKLLSEHIRRFDCELASAAQAADKSAIGLKS
ncbi:bacteriohemerythrin [Uliginosibacterium sediminicola]|uniref:Bacteriohemerythrin n=1 Tax=Uliginosibacterium sediminicola TaxID=2024550 RepID=A0ABU9YV99_9RHOO